MILNLNMGKEAILVESNFYNILEQKENKEQIQKKINNFLINKKENEFLVIDISPDCCKDKTCFTYLDKNGLVKSFEYLD